MTKSHSEADVKAALNYAADDLEGLFSYKPPDDARNTKPCDFMVWWQGKLEETIPVGFAAWIEVKDVTATQVFSMNELRPSQRAGIRAAAAAGIPYLLAVYWRLHQDWTISDAIKLTAEPHPAVSRTLLMSRYGVQSTPGQLGSTLRLVLEEGF